MTTAATRGRQGALHVVIMKPDSSKEAAPVRPTGMLADNFTPQKTTLPRREGRGVNGRGFTNYVVECMIVKRLSAESQEPPRTLVIVCGASFIYTLSVHSILFKQFLCSCHVKHANTALKTHLYQLETHFLSVSMSLFFCHKQRFESFPLHHS